MQLKDAKKSGGKRAPITLIDALHQRRSVRAFAAEPVMRADLEEIIDAAIQAPSAMNEQPWHFTVVTNAPLLSEISTKAKAHALEEFGKESHLDHARQMLSDSKFDIFYGAPALVVISASRGSSWAIEDSAMAAQNLMLAAHAIGFGKCWIGFAQRWLNTSQGRAAIGLSETQLAVAPIIVGRPKATPPAVARRTPIICWIV